MPRLFGAKSGAIYFTRNSRNSKKVKLVPKVQRLDLSFRRPDQQIDVPRKTSLTCEIHSGPMASKEGRLKITSERVKIDAT